MSRTRQASLRVGPNPCLHSTYANRHNHTPPYHPISFQLPHLRSLSHSYFSNMAPTNLNPRLLAGDESPPRVHARQFVPGSLAGGPAEYIARFAHGRSIPNPFDIDELDSAIDREAAMTSSASSQREMAQPDSDSSLMTPTFETETDSESTSTMPEFLTNELPSAPSWAREPTKFVETPWYRLSGIIY